MRFGTVKFFKRLIVAILAFAVVLPTVLAVVFGVLFARQQKRANWLETVNWALLNNAEIPGEIQNTDDIAKYFQNKPENFELSPSFDYQLKHPNLYFSRPKIEQTQGKVCYLTFDDGPSLVTMQVLKTLEDYGIKATFFVTGANSRENEEVLLAAANAGHTIAVHSFSHDYEKIYTSVEAYLDDFELMHSRILALTGKSSGIFRFPGGSINGYNQSIYTEIIAEMVRRGFTFFDWNAAAADAVVGGISKEQIVQNVLNSAAGQEKVVLLMHDRGENATTAAALGQVIQALSEQGYQFLPLGANVQPITYFYQN